VEPRSRGQRVVVWMKAAGEDRAAVIESGDDESLNTNTTACFVKTNVSLVEF